jgi:hypothetical protein
MGRGGGRRTRQRRSTGEGARVGRWWKGWKLFGIGHHGTVDLVDISLAESI